MSYEIGTAANAADLLNKLNTFLTSKGKAYGASFVGTGNGAISAWDGGASSVSETFTITATSATQFSVVGSVSGNIGTATVGTTFTHAKLTFLISAGSTAFVAGDAFRINTCPPWTSMRAVAGSEMIWMAPGNDGTEQIFTGAKLFSDAGTDYYNWRLQGMTGFAAGNPFTNQPGQLGVTNNPIVTLWNASTPYWFVANGQRVIMMAKIGVMYACAYLGFWNSYISPGQVPYPLFIGGNLAFSTEPAVADARWRYSYTGIEMHAFWRGYPSNMYSTITAASGRFRSPEGVYHGIEANGAASCVNEARVASAWPYSTAGDAPGTTNAGMMGLRANLDGSYPLLPIFFASDNGPSGTFNTNTWGELDGIRAVPGYANASENTIVDGFITHVVFQDTYRTGRDCYCAVALD